MKPNLPLAAIFLFGHAKCSTFSDTADELSAKKDSSSILQIPLTSTSRGDSKVPLSPGPYGMLQSEVLGLENVIQASDRMGCAVAVRHLRAWHDSDCSSVTIQVALSEVSASESALYHSLELALRDIKIPPKSHLDIAPVPEAVVQLLHQRKNADPTKYDFVQAEDSATLFLFYPYAAPSCTVPAGIRWRMRSPEQLHYDANNDVNFGDTASSDANANGWTYWAN